MKLSLTCIAALIAASPAMAQDFCGGVGAGGQWIGGTQSASDISTAESHREQLALVLGETPYIGLFSVSSTTSVRIEAAGRGAGDPLIEIFNADGNIVASDDDSGGGGAARAEMDFEQGTYCVAMKSYENAPMSAFMRIGRTEQDALTNAASAETAAPASTGSCADARAFGPLGTTQSASVDDAAFWSFTLDAPTALKITANNSDADPKITLFDADQNDIAENDDHDGLNARIEDTTAYPAGDYCLQVGAINDTSLPIEISISEYDPEAALAELYAKGAAAPPLDGTVEVAEIGVLQSRMRQDVQATAQVNWFTIDVPEAGMILVEALSAGEGGDPWLVMYDDLGRKLGENDDAANTLNSMVAARVLAGTYIIGVKQVGEDQTGFIRLVLERYVAAQ